MDLYSAGLSISQGDNLSAQVQQANDSAQDFNNSLAEQLDQAKTDADSVASTSNLLTLAKNTPVGAKVLANPIVKGALTVAKNVVIKPPPDIQMFSMSELGSAAPVAEEAAEAAPALENIAGRVASAGAGVLADVAAPVVENIAENSLGKGLLAGAGAAIEIGKDIQRGNWGSNWEQKLGGVAGIAGSTLEVAGALTAWTGLGAGVEAAGLGLSLASGGLESVGDAKKAVATKGQATADVLSQTRSITAGQAPQVIAARSN